jgi:hypothetical protein
MRGLKPIGVAACLAALLISAFAIVWRYNPVNPAISSLSMPLLLKALAAIKPAAIGAICVDLAALVAWFVIVRNDWVRDAGDQFARALLARCDTLDVSPAARPSSAASARRTRPASTANAESLRTRSGGGDP